MSSLFVFSSSLLLCIYSRPFLVWQSSQLDAVFIVFLRISSFGSQNLVSLIFTFCNRETKTEYLTKVLSNIQIHCCCCFELSIEMSYHYEEFHSSYDDNFARLMLFKGVLIGLALREFYSRPRK